MPRLPVWACVSQGCHQGFALTSLGGDGVLTEDRTYTPADEMTCRFFYGRETWQLPQPYWQIATDRGR